MKTFQKLSCLFATALFLLLVNPANADHLLGGDITWKSMGTDTYLVSLSIYRDCKSISLTDPVMRFTDCSGSPITTGTTAKKILVKNITPICKSACTRCGKNPNQYPGNTSCKFPYGVEKFVFQQKVIFSKLAKTCCNIKISWSDCCRPDYIASDTNGGSIYIEANLNRCAKGDNSPVFNSEPLSIICQNQCIAYDFSAHDDDLDSKGDHDSLVYSLYRPNTTDSKSYYTYPGLYTWDKPLYFDSFPNKSAVWYPPACNGFHLDSINGLLYFKPLKIQNAVLGLMVTEYGRDATGKRFKKGEIHRDIIVMVASCNNNKVPTLTGINGTNFTDIHFCVGRMNCFTINSNDVDINDTVSIAAHLGILSSLGATVTTEVKRQHPRTTFCWKPDSTMVSSYPYSFTINANDDACPLNGNTAKAFNIYVNAAEDDTFTVKQTGVCNEYTFKAFPKTGTKAIRAFWEGDDGLFSRSATLTHKYNAPGTYKYILYTDFSFLCGRVDSGVIVIPSGLSLSLPRDTTVCNGTTLSLSAIAKYGHPPYKYLWNTGETKAIIKPVIAKNTSFSVRLSDSFCSVYDTINVFSKPLLATPSISRIGKDTLKASAYAVKYLWFRDSILIPDSQRVIHAARPGSYQVQLLNLNGCLSPLSAPYIITGISPEPNTTNNINIYPNPTSGLIHIESASVQEGYLSLIDMTGKVILRTTIQGKIDLDLHNYPKGIYLLKIQDKNDCIINRVIRW
jgi:hypothetical protein